MPETGNIYFSTSRLLQSFNLVKLIFLILFLIVSSISCNKIEPDGIMVFAAASLADPLTEISGKYQDSQINFDFAGSYTLRNKIRFGPKVDVVIFAGMDPLSDLIKEKYIEKDTVSVLLTNGLAIICSKKIECPDRHEVFNSSYRIAIADPNLAPLGKYSKEFIEEKELWDKIKGKLVYNLDARATIVSVETGNVPLGIVYLSDAIASDQVDIIVNLKNTSIVAEYPIAVIDGSINKEKALNFVEFLKSEDSMKVFSEYGFQSSNLDRWK